MDLARHRGVVAAMPAKVANCAADPGQAHPGEAVADVSQVWIGMVFYAQAIDLAAAALRASATTMG